MNKTTKNCWGKMPGLVMIIIPFCIVLVIAGCSRNQSSNQLANTTWEGYWTGTKAEASIIFGETSFKLTCNDVISYKLVTGTYKISGENVVFNSSSKYISMGTLLNGTLAIPEGGGDLGLGFVFTQVR